MDETQIRELLKTRKPTKPVWTRISQIILSEDFIREFKDKVDWYWISIRQTLSEPFIKEFKDKVDWEEITEYQTLSENYIKELCKIKVKKAKKSNYVTLKEFQSLIGN